MKLCSDTGIDGQVWRCRKYISGVSRHDRKASIRKSSIFEGCKLTVQTILYCLYEWAVLSPVEQTAHELCLDDHTVIEWYRKFRTVASRLVESITGENIGMSTDIVEIDECQIGRRKHNSGRRRNEVWLLGMIVRGSNPRVCSFRMSGVGIGGL